MAEYWELIGGLIDRLIEEAREDATRWTELVDKLDDVPADIRQRWLDRLRALSGESALTEGDRGRIWEVLRGLVARHREFEDARWRLPEQQIDAIAEVAELFRPDSPRISQAWLFSEHAPSLDGVRRINNHVEYEKTLRELRAAAMTEIVEVSSWDEIVDFARAANVPFAVGQAMVDAGLIAYDDHFIELINSDNQAEQELARAYCIDRNQKEPGWLEEKLSLATLPPRHQARLLLCVTDIHVAWTAADAAGPEVAKEYWLGFGFLPRPDPADLASAATRMTNVGRAAAALNLLALWLPEQVDPKLTTAIEHALDQFLEQGHEGQWIPPGYDIERLLSYLDRSSSATTARIARLEWSYLVALEHTHRRLRLFEELANNSGIFVDLVTSIYRPRESEDEGEVSDEPTETPDEAAVRLAANAWRLLHRWNIVPGTRDDGHIDTDKLREWVSTARERLKTLKRAEVGDVHIGTILAASPVDPDGIRPLAEIRELIEDLHGSEIESGFRTAIINARGITSRGLGEGGGQERDLAADFRAQADQLADRWPTTARIFRSIADGYESDARRSEADAERFRKGLEGPGGGPLQSAEDSSQDEVLYFAYGSNMSTARTEARVGKVRARGRARLAEYKIEFSKASVDGTGKTNIIPDKPSEVWGVLFGMSNKQFEQLAAHGRGYLEVTVPVCLGDEDMTARTFIAKERTSGLRPTREYLDFLIAGAHEHQLPAHYTKTLEAIKVADDGGKLERIK